MDAHYALANVLDQRPPYELSRLSDTYVLPRPQSKAQDCCFLRTSFEDLMRSDAASKFANEARSCRTRSTTTRSCLLSINTPCDHISASGTSSTHASALAKGLGTLRNRVLQRCCTTVLHYPSVRTTAHTHTPDPSSLDTTDQWAIPRLLLKEAPACRPPEAQAPRHRLPEHAPEDRQDRHPPGVNFNQSLARRKH